MRISDTSFLDPAQTDTPRRNRFAVNRMAGTVPSWKPRVLSASFAPSQIVRTDITTGHKPGFADLVDIINPLQHIPVVGHVYRKMTGDEISPPAQFIGSALYGGPLGAVAALTDIAVREQTGKGNIDTMMGFLGRGPAEAETPAPMHLAQRRTENPRTAGTMPVWGQDTQPVAVPPDPLGSETKFALLLKDLNA